MLKRVRGLFAASGSDLRESPRKQARDSAMILLNAQRNLPCVVRDISATGARVGIPRHVFLPREFAFQIPSSNMHVRARMKWRSGDHIGISFARK